ncbi:hypothetical protein BGZ97_008903 [Linnemannia gamsii]|uniref:Uncharacterized protein n=1 Tax=Linnemannia gamsii TaxID=64522 RepID=A0A9P6RB11_9FUNG|nr:hypothetical protein BGZ97_008903 [Linnemannia gamsii]
MGEAEYYLRMLVETRRTGRLEYPAGDDLAPKAPEVFVVGLLYAQTSFGFGFMLPNGVAGVTCNDNVTVVLSLNGEHIEVIHGTEVEEPYNFTRKRKLRHSVDGVDSASSRGAKKLDTYHKMDDQDYLKTLERSYFRMEDIPPQFAEKVKLCTSIRSLRTPPDWTFVDEDLKRDMPFMMDNFQYDYTVTRLNSGIMEALSAEFFYNLNDPKDQIKTIQDELDQITRARKTQGGLHLMPGPCNLHKDSETCGDETCRANTLETRPQFNLEEDTDLYLFPRPNLEGQIQTALKGILPSTQDLLAAGQDASQIEERPIRSVDKQVVIRQMSFKSLHEEIVLRLRIAQRLMRERAIWLAQKRVKKEKEERARAKKQCQ